MGSAPKGCSSPQETAHAHERQKRTFICTKDTYGFLLALSSIAGHFQKGKGCLLAQDMAV